MILTQKRILEEIKKGNIKIEPFNKNQVGPASVDLHLGPVFRRFIHHNEVFQVKEEANFEEITELVELKKGQYLLLKPQETVLGVTQEKITLSPNIAAWIEGRSRFARIGLGVHITSGFVHPGVSNYQVLEITNLSPTPLGLYPGTRICQLVFEKCEGRAVYRGRFKIQEKP